MEHIQRLYDARHGRYAAKLMPGELYVSLNGEVLVTTLGSCISACVFDPVTGHGGMNHFMLPIQAANARPWGDDVAGNSNRYGNWAMTCLVETMLRYGSRPSDLQIKIFGGARMTLGGTENVGLRNIEFVREYLRETGLPVLAEDVAEDYARRVVFDTENGRVWVKRLRHLRNQTISEREVAYSRRVRDLAAAGMRIPDMASGSLPGDLVRWPR